MITPAYVRKMAAYNRWQNQNLYGTAGKLTMSSASSSAAPSSAPSLARSTICCGPTRCG